MTYLVAFIVCFIAGIGAGLGTGFAGMSAAAVISPMLITFLGMDPYMAVGIALASDVLASAISAYTYGKSGNLDIKNGAVMMASVLCFTLVGSYVASLVPGTTMGGFSTFMTLLLGVKFIVRPVMTTKSAMNAVSAQKRFAQSLLCGAGVNLSSVTDDGSNIVIDFSGMRRTLASRSQSLYLVFVENTSTRMHKCLYIIAWIFGSHQTMFGIFRSLGNIPVYGFKSCSLLPKPP